MPAAFAAAASSSVVTSIIEIFLVQRFQGANVGDGGAQIAAHDLSSQSVNASRKASSAASASPDAKASMPTGPR